jgi:hypothetical protein
MPKDHRGLDHLMEQNEAELDFLSAYGGVDDGQGSDGEAIVAALERFLKAGGITCAVSKGELKFAFGTATVDENGCHVRVQGAHLPLVTSDLHGPGFNQPQLSHDRSEVTVCLTRWGLEQRRFIERMVEHHLAAV